MLEIHPQSGRGTRRGTGNARPRKSAKRRVASGKKIGTGADGAATEIEDTPVEHREEAGYEVAEAVAARTRDYAILCRGTGPGMSMTANKVPGVIPAQRSDV